VAGDDNGVQDVFVRNLRTHTTRRASLDTAGGDANGDSPTLIASISGDGRHVAFMSPAGNLVPGDGNGLTVS
jgi:Tol biopolymer transport system component